MNVISIYFRPLRNDEALPKQSYKPVIKDASLKTTSNDQQNIETSATKSKSKKAKVKEVKSIDTSEKSSHSHKKKKIKSKEKDTENGQNDVDLLGTPIKDKATKEKKSSKEKSNNKKEKKDKKSSKIKKLPIDGSKSGYEEALGISTPSKEIY